METANRDGRPEAISTTPANNTNISPPESSETRSGVAIRQSQEKGDACTCVFAAVHSNSHARPFPRAHILLLEQWDGCTYVALRSTFRLFHTPSLTAHAKPCPPPTACHSDLPPTLCFDTRTRLTAIAIALCLGDCDCYFVLEAHAGCLHLLLSCASLRHNGLQ